MMPCRSWLLATRFLALLFLPLSADGTTVAVVVSRDQVVIAADALSNSFRTGDNEPSQRQECKISLVGYFAFAISGIVESQRTGFNAVQLISEALRQCNDCSINRAAIRAMAVLKAPLARAWSSLIETMPEQAARMKEVGGAGRLRFVVALYGGSEPQAVFGEMNSDGSVGFLPHAGGLSDDKVAVRMLGSEMAAGPFLEGFMPDATREDIGDLEAFARRLVQMEIDYSASNDPFPVVGPPINVAALRIGSFAWGDPSPTCSSPSK